jgi:MOSC domain-containing protein YiiM
MNARSARSLAAGSRLKALLDGPIAPGRLVWIGVRPGRREPLLELGEVELAAGHGVAGDRYRTASNGARQVTLIERERLMAIASYLGCEIHPAQLRRNLMVEGINLLALKDRRFRVGSALLEWSGECHPCSRMDETLGTGGYNAVRSHGGISARVLEGAVVRVGETVEQVG